MTFNFNSAIPAANNNPSVDQPDMLINNQSTEAILNVDHVTFNTANGGKHQQVTFNNKNVPGAQTDPQSVLYTNSGTASSVSQQFYRSQNGIFQVSPIKAWGYADSSPAILASQSVNVSTITKVSTGIFAVTLTTNSVSGDKFAILVSADSSTPSLAGKYHITAAAAFQLQFFDTTTNTLRDPNNFSFIVLQI